MRVLFWFYKSHTNKKGLAPIMMRITLNGQRINFPTQVNIEERQWDKNKQQVKGNDELAKRYNLFLLNLKSKAWDFYSDSVKADEPITPALIRDHVLGSTGTNHTLIEAFEYQITQLTSRIGHDIAFATVRNYKSCKQKILNFLRSEKGGEDVLLSQLNHQFIHELDTYLRAKERLHNNGVVKQMQQLKRVIKVAILNEWLTKDPFTHYTCKIIEPKRSFLTKEELYRLETMAVPSDRLSKVKDIFIFSCYTGLAYADVSKLNPLHLQVINGKTWLLLDRTKTKNQSVIPLLPVPQRILNKYAGQTKGRLLPVISSQNLNKYLKELAELAAINKRLSFHAARHTFASTVTLNNEVDITTVSAMLGHKLLKTTQIYARVNMEKIAADVEELMKKGT